MVDFLLKPHSRSKKHYTLHALEHATYFIRVWFIYWFQEVFVLILLEWISRILHKLTLSLLFRIIDHLQLLLACRSLERKPYAVYSSTSICWQTTTWAVDKRSVSGASCVRVNSSSPEHSIKLTFSSGRVNRMTCSLCLFTSSYSEIRVLALRKQGQCGRRVLSVRSAVTCALEVDELCGWSFPYSIYWQTSLFLFG